MTSDQSNSIISIKSQPLQKSDFFWIFQRLNIVLSNRSLYDLFWFDNEQIKYRFLHKAYIVFLSKYKHTCITQSPMVYSQSENKISISENFKKDLIECDKKEHSKILLCFMFVKPHENSKEQYHCLLIINTVRKRIELYNPLLKGSQATEHIRLDHERILSTVTEFIRGIKGFKLYQKEVPFYYCPSFKTSSIHKYDLFCRLWSLFLMELRLINYNLNPHQVLQKFFNSIDNEPTVINNLIKNYATYLDMEIKKLREFVSSR